MGEEAEKNVIHNLVTLMRVKAEKKREEDGESKRETERNRHSKRERERSFFRSFSHDH